MTEDDEFNLLEQRLKQKGKEMYRPLEDAKTLADLYNHEAEEEHRAMNEYQMRTANAKLSANEKQVAGDHYLEMIVEPWDVIDTWPLEQRIGFYRGNALKYIMRCGSKDDRLQEIKKAGHYIEKLIEIIK